MSTDDTRCWEVNTGEPLPCSLRMYEGMPGMNSSICICSAVYAPCVKNEYDVFISGFDRRMRERVALDALFSPCPESCTD